MNDKLKMIKRYVHIDKENEFGVLFTVLHGLGFTYMNCGKESEIFANINAWGILKEKTVILVESGKVTLWGSVDDYTIRTPLHDYHSFRKIISSCITTSDKLLQTPEDIAIVATIFEHLSHLLSSKKLQYKVQFIDISSSGVAKYACTAGEICEKLGLNIEVKIHAEMSCVIYRFYKVQDENRKS
jgi:hypothetical protein